MAERKRGFFDRLFGQRASPEQTAKLNEMIGGREMDWDGKALASMSKIQMATKTGQPRSQGADTPVSYDLLREISTKSEVVNAILRRAVDDTLANGYHFVLAPGKEQGSDEQLWKASEFFRTPNPDDMGDEWLESLLFDLILFGDAYLELDGTMDTNSNEGEDWNFGGDLKAIWPVASETIKIIPAKQTPKPPKMAYVQNINRTTRKFSADKIIHIAKFKQGRAYGSSPIIPLLETITGQLNLSNYLNALYTGTLPKTILNVGDISNSEMKAMLGLIEQQLSGGKSPFGLIAINGGTGFNMHRLLDSTREGAQLDLLYYYREEICAVFGIPPMKLGWVQTGKLANPEQQLDAWYDVVESYHHRLSAMINNKILPLIGITDWRFQFISIRPARETERADTLKSQATAISTLRQESAISINEAREILGFPMLESPIAHDPFFISPKLQINQPSGADQSTDVPSLIDLYPPEPTPEGEGKSAGEFPQFTDEHTLSADFSEEAKAAVGSKRAENRKPYDKIESNTTKTLNEAFGENQSVFAKRLMDAYNDRFQPDDVIELSLNGSRLRKSVKKAINPYDIEWAVDLLDAELAGLLDKQVVAASTSLTSAYDKTLLELAKGTGLEFAFTIQDAEAMAYWNSRWRVPALRHTLGAYRKQILTVFDRMNAERQSWDWAARRMRGSIDPSGKSYPRYYYERIARTETRRVVENAHLSGLKKAGFKQVQRLVTIDKVTDADLCAPFENEVYPLDKSGGVLPAHPNCRCDFVAYLPADEAKPIAPLSDSEILKPDVEGAEILDLQ